MTQRSPPILVVWASRTSSAWTRRSGLPVERKLIFSSSCRMSEAQRRSKSSPISAWLPSIALKSSLDISAVTHSDSARMVAVRPSPSIAAISPNALPAPTVAMVISPFSPALCTTRATPLTRNRTELPGLKRSTMIAPAAKRRGLHLRSSARRSSIGRVCSRRMVSSDTSSPAVRGSNSRRARRLENLRPDGGEPLGHAR